MNTKSIIRDLSTITGVVVGTLIMGALITLLLTLAFSPQEEWVKVSSKIGLLGVLAFVFKRYPQPIHWRIGNYVRSFGFVGLFVLYGLIMRYLFQNIEIKADPVSVYSIISAAILAPVLEELLFRGWIVSYLQKRGWADLWIIAISAIAFYLWHGQPIGIHRLISGVLLSFIYLRSKDITTCILCHSAYNLLQID